MSPPDPRNPGGAASSNGHSRRGWLARLLRRPPKEDASVQGLRRLALQVSFDLGESEQGRCLMLTSPSDATVHGQAALQLAHFLAEEQGHRVLVVDCSFGRPGIRDMLRYAGSPGLLDLLDGTAHGLADVALGTDHERIDFLPVGQTRLGLTAALKQDRLRRVLEEAREAYDWVLLHCRPVLEDSTVMAFPALADCVLLFTIEGESLLHDLDEAQKVLQSCQAARVGLVLTTAGRRRRASRS